MKKILKYLPLVAALALVSCVKDAPSKSEVEAGFDKFAGTMPTVTIASSASEIDAAAGTATVNVTFAGLSDQLDSLSVGILSDTDPTFANASFVKYDNPTNGTVSLKAKVSANSHYYVRGVVAFNKGTSFSDVIEIEVPDIPFRDKAAGTYSGAAPGYWGDKYTATIQIVADPEDNSKVKVYNLDSYLVSIGYTAEKGYNIYSGTIDEENLQIIVENGSSPGLNGFALYGFSGPDPDSAEGYADIVLKFNSKFSSVTVPNAWGLSTAAGWYEIYLGGAVLAKQ